MTDEITRSICGSLAEGMGDQLHKTASIQIGYVTVKGAPVEKLFQILQLAQLGFQNSVVMGNSGLCGAGVYLAGCSALGWNSATDPIAKKLYILSFGLAGCSAASSGVSACARRCEIDQFATVGESLSLASYKLAQRIQERADKLNNQPIDRKSLVRRRLINAQKNYQFNNKNLGFTGHYSPLAIETISYSTISKGVALVFVIYAYGKYLTFCYRTSKKVIQKFKNYRKSQKSKMFRKQLRYLIMLYYKQKFENYKQKFEKILIVANSSI
jgi:hypothetical protein